MGFYDDPANVKQYLTMCQDYDGNDLYQRLCQHLPDQSTLLEVGSGGGLDLDYLKQHFLVTGSDLSDAFLDALKARQPDIDFLKLDAQSFSIQKSSIAFFQIKFYTISPSLSLRSHLRYRLSTCYREAL